MERTKSHRTGVSTFASRTSPITEQSLQKSFHLSTPKEFQNIFSNASKKNKTPDTQANTTMKVKLNNDNGLQTLWTRTPAGNMRNRCTTPFSRKKFVVSEKKRPH
jgi:hypothetical protein